MIINSNSRNKPITLCDIFYFKDIDELNQQLIERGQSAEDIISIAPSLTQGGYTYEVIIKEKIDVVDNEIIDASIPKELLEKEK